MFEKIIKEEIENLNEYFHEAWLEQLEEEQIEKFVKSLSKKIGCEVVAEGTIQDDFTNEKTIVRVTETEDTKTTTYLNIAEVMKRALAKYSHGTEIEILIKVKEQR